MPQINNVYKNQVTLVKYLESTGTQYIDTGYTATENTSCEVTVLKNSENTTAIWGCFGARDVPATVSTSFTHVAASSSSAFRLDFINKSGDFVGSWNALQDNTEVCLKLSKEYASFNDTILYYATPSGTLTTSSQALFCIHQDNAFSANAKIKMKSAKYYEYGVAIFNFQPATLTSTGEAGMWDSVSKSFFTNDGTGVFLTGPTLATTARSMIPTTFNRLGIRKSSNSYDADSTVMEFTITDDYKTVSLYSVTCDSIDWGDGTEDTSTNHTYTDNGTYTVEIKGNTALQMENTTTGNYTLTKVLHLSDYFITAYRMFYYCRNLVEINSTDWNTSSITSLCGFVQVCSSLTTLDASKWDTSKVTNFSSFVYGCTSLTSLDVSDWDTSSVTNFSNFAYSCSSLTTLDVSNWNTSSVTNFSNFVAGCSSLTALDVSKWGTSNVTNISQFAHNCTSLTTLDVSDWVTSSVTTFYWFVYSCSSLTALDVSNWDTSCVTTFQNFAQNCSILTTLDLSSWVIQESANITNVAYGCTSITEAYAIDQATCDRLNATAKGTATWEFVVKPTQETE